VKRWGVILFALSVCLLAASCGGTPTLVIDKIIGAGPVDYMITGIAATRMIESPREVFSPEAGLTLETDEIHSQRGMFLVVTYNVKNESDKNAVAPEPQIRTAEGVTYPCQAKAMFMALNEAGIEPAGSSIGTELKSLELKGNVYGIYDLPNLKDLEIVIMDGYEVSGAADKLTNATGKGKAYKIEASPEICQKATIDMTTIVFGEVEILE